MQLQNKVKLQLKVTIELTVWANPIQANRRWANWLPGETTAITLKALKNTSDLLCFKWCKLSFCDKRESLFIFVKGLQLKLAYQTDLMKMKLNQMHILNCWRNTCLKTQEINSVINTTYTVNETGLNEIQTYMYNGECSVECSTD